MSVHCDLRDPSDMRGAENGRARPSTQSGIALAGPPSENDSFSLIDGD